MTGASLVRHASGSIVWRRAALVVLCAALLQAAASQGESPAAEKPYRYSDAHLHALDFFQQGDPISELIEIMDKGRIGDAMISGASLMKKWHENEPKRPRYYAGDSADLYWYSATDNYLAEELQKLSERDRRRLHPFLSGINPTDKNAVIHLEKMMKLYPGMWQGIGEVLVRHDDLTMMASTEPPRANSEAMDRIYRFAGKHDLPVLLHNNITSKRERNPLYLDELSDTLSKHPKVKFIWAHAGTSKTLERYQGEMDFLLPSLKKLLEKHDNLYIDLSWSVLKPYMLDKDDKPVQGWVDLMEEYPTHFVLGSDVLGRFDKVDDNLKEFDTFLQALSHDTAQRVARDNFLALLPKDSTEDGVVAER